MKLAILMLAALSAAAQTLIQDKLYTPINGALFEGRLTITAPEMVWEGKTYVRSSRDVTVSAGNLTVRLIPNTVATPSGTAYTVRYQPSAGSPWTETWVVPSSATPVKVADVRVVTLPSQSILLLLSQLSTAGATEGSCIRFTGGQWTVVPADQCGSGGNLPTGKTWAQLTTFTWSQLNTHTWSQML